MKLFIDYIIYIQSATIFFRASSFVLKFFIIAMVKYMRAEIKLCGWRMAISICSHIICHVYFLFFHHRFVNNYFSIFIFIICAPFCRFFLLPPTCIQTQNTILLKLIYVSVFSPRYHSLIINTTIFNLVHFWHQTKIHQFF